MHGRQITFMMVELVFENKTDEFAQIADSDEFNVNPVLDKYSKK